MTSVNTRTHRCRVLLTALLTGILSISYGGQLSVLGFLPGPTEASSILSDNETSCILTVSQDEFAQSILISSETNFQPEVITPSGTTAWIIHLQNLNAGNNVMHISALDELGNLTVPAYFSINCTSPSNNLSSNTLLAFSLHLSDTSSESSAYTNSRLISVNVFWDSTISQGVSFYITENATSTPNAAQDSPGWLDHIVSYSILGLEGPITLSVFSRDFAGNLAVTSSTIALDLTQPSSASLFLADPSNGNRLTTNQRTLQLIVSAQTNLLDIAGFLVSENSFLPLENVPLWLPNLPSTLNLLSDGDGPKSVFLYFKDLAGNIAVSSASIVLNTSPKAIGVLNKLWINDTEISLTQVDQLRMKPLQTSSKKPKLNVKFEAADHITLINATGTNTSFGCLLTTDLAIKTTTSNASPTINLDITLLEGKNSISYEFMNSEGTLLTLSAIQVIADFTPPFFTFSPINTKTIQLINGGAYSFSTKEEAIFRLLVSDNVEVSTVNAWLNGVLVFSKTALHPTSDLRITLNTTMAQGMQNLHIECTDGVGNMSELACSILMSGPVSIIGNVLNYPNPMKADNGSTFQYNLSSASNIKLVLFDMAAHEMMVQTFMANSAGGKSGLNKITWDGRDKQGRKVGSGLYLLKVYTDNSCLGSCKIIVINN